MQSRVKFVLMSSSTKRSGRVCWRVQATRLRYISSNIVKRESAAKIAAKLDCVDRMYPSALQYSSTQVQRKAVHLKLVQL